MALPNEPFQPAILTVPTDMDTGMDVDAVQALLAGGAHPAFIYAVTDGHNPLAVSMSPGKRARLVRRWIGCSKHCSDGRLLVDFSR